MPNAMLTRTSVSPAAALSPRVAVAARRLVDAVTEFDAALDQGLPMHVLVRLDQEVTAAEHGHRAALAAVTPEA